MSHLFIHRTSNQVRTARLGYNTLGDTHIALGEKLCGVAFDEITVMLCDGIPNTRETWATIETEYMSRLRPGGKLVLQT